MLTFQTGGTQWLRIEIGTHTFPITVSNEKSSLRLANLVLALLCCALRELPENAELVEKIVFHPNVDIVSLMKSPNNLLRLVQNLVNVGIEIRSISNWQSDVLNANLVSYQM